MKKMDSQSQSLDVLHTKLYSSNYSRKLNNVSGLISLNDILCKDITEAAKLDSEQYLMIPSILEDSADVDEDTNRQIIVTRMEIVFNERDSQLLTLTDITIHKRLELQENKNHILTMMNANMHHEILTPLKVNIQVAEKLSTLQDISQLKEMAQIVSVSSKLVLFQANNLLDHRNIQNGSFAPAYSCSSIPNALLEVVEMMRWTI